MRNLSAAKPVRLISPWTLAFSAVAMGGVLFLTYNSEEVFLPDGQRADDVSASYAEVLLASRPEDDKLRLDLIELLIDLGQYSRARRHLLGWEQPDLTQLEYYRLKIDALSALQDDSPARLGRARAQLLAFDYDKLPVDQALSWADLALRMEMPWLAAEVYHSLALRVPEEYLAYLKRAARWYLASNQPGKAAMIYLDILAASDTVEDRRYYLRKAYDALLALGATEQAARLLVSELDELNTTEADAQWLQQAVQIAVGTQRLDLAKRLIDRWRQLRPADAEPVEAQFRLQLASGQLREAWQTGDLLLALRPDDADLLKQMAQLGGWLGHTEQALDYWVEYLSLREDPEARELAWRLAFQLFDFQQGIDLLTPIAEDRKLSQEKLDAVVYGYDSLGRPEDAEAWLRQYLLRYPSHRVAWERLLQNLENTRQFQKQIAVWERMEERFELSIAERVGWASAYWRIYQPARAWEILDIENSDIEDPDYWRTRAGLAWELERDKELRLVYERMLELGIDLTKGERSQLIEYYRADRPRKALEMLVEGWREDASADFLVQALDQAALMGELQLIRDLLAEAARQPAIARLPGVLLARGRLAEQDRDLDEAERIYRAALARYPGNPMIRERMLWFFIDHRRTVELPMLLQRWRGFAKRSSNLWLPFATASQMLGKNQEALAWFRLYLRSNPYDWLARAAYVDALEAAGRFDLAQRLRQRLVLEFNARPEDIQNMPAGQAILAPQRYAVWLRLLASSQSGRQALKTAQQWQDGSPAMLQLWFDQWIRQLDIINQPAQKDAWLAWARSRGLTVDPYSNMQQALRQYNREMLQRLLESGELDPVQRVAALDRLGEESQALASALSELGAGNPAVINNQLRRQAVDLRQRTPQGARVKWSRQDFGGLELGGPQLTLAGHVKDDWYATLDLNRQSYSADTLDESVMGEEASARLTLSRKLANGRLSLELHSSQRSDQDRSGLGVSRTWQLSSRDQLEAGLDWNEESRESGFMRAFGTQDAVWFAGRHGFSARDQLAWSFEQRAYGTRYGESLGSGKALSIAFNQIQQFEGPTWVMRTGIDYQRNNLSDSPLSDLATADGGALLFPRIDATTLLQEEYGRIYAGTSWQRGFPGSLNRNQPDYTWLVDMQAGWDWIDSQMTYGINAGMGARVFGDDELALTFGYQSAPRGTDAESGGVLELTYSKNFGR